MAKSNTGIIIDWEAEHRDGQGNLVSRQAKVQPPDAIECVKITCLWRFTVKAIRYVLLQLYHKYRADYAERHRHNDIPMKYRTGEPSPLTIREAIWEILKLKVRR